MCKGLNCSLVSPTNVSKNEQKILFDCSVLPAFQYWYEEHDLYPMNNIKFSLWIQLVLAEFNVRI